MITLVKLVGEACRKQIDDKSMQFLAEKTPEIFESIGERIHYEEVRMLNKENGKSREGSR